MPLLVVHGEFGAPGWLEAFQRLAQDRDVIVPSLPGYGRTACGARFISPTNHPSSAATSGGTSGRRKKPTASNSTATGLFENPICTA
jgi:pimeloyl-ACP methyl ester carboxylesterase